MVRYTCSRCKKIFKQKIDYTRHIKRKRPCHEAIDKNNEIIDENNELQDDIEIIYQNMPNSVPAVPKYTKIEEDIRCKYCKREFTQKSSLNRHLKGRCKKKKEYDEESKKLYQLLLTKLQEHESKIRQLEEENMMLKAPQNQFNNINTDNSVHNTNTTNNTNNGIVNNNQVNIHINALGHENTDYLTMKDKVEIVEKMHKSIVTYIEKINFNPDHPENHNVYVQNLKNSYGAMFNGDRWETRHISDIVETMMDYGRNKIEEIREELKEKGKIRNYVEGRLDELFNAVDGDDSEASKNIMKVSEERIKFLAYDSREVVKETMDQWMENNRMIRNRKKLKAVKL